MDYYNFTIILKVRASFFRGYINEMKHLPQKSIDICRWNTHNIKCDSFHLSGESVHLEMANEVLCIVCRQYQHQSTARETFSLSQILEQSLVQSSRFYDSSRVFGLTPRRFSSVSFLYYWAWLLALLIASSEMVSRSATKEQKKISTPKMEGR